MGPRNVRGSSGTTEIYSESVSTVCKIRTLRRFHPPTPIPPRDVRSRVTEVVVDFRREAYVLVETEGRPEVHHGVLRLRVVALTVLVEVEPVPLVDGVRLGRPSTLLRLTRVLGVGPG